MIVSRQHASQFPLSLPILLVIISPLWFIEVINGQPNFYFKASAPAVKSLPRIGRRSDDMSAGENFLPTSLNGGQNSMSLARALDLPGGMLDMWSGTGEMTPFGGNVGSGRSSSLSFPISGSLAPGGSSLLSPIPPSTSQLDKSLLWRKFLGELNNYEETLLDNIYRSKS